MDIDLNELSQEELEQLKSDVEKALVTLEDRNRKKAVEAAQNAAREYGFNLQELLSAVDAVRGVVPKFRNPDNHKETWAGRGRKPRWLIEALESGRSLEEFRL